MTERRECRTQAGCDKALQDGALPVLIGAGVWFIIQGSAHVEARESAHVEASCCVSVHRHGAMTTVTGGVQIMVPVPRTPTEWCEFYGVAVKKGVAILFKAVRDDYRSAYGLLYAPGTTPEASDWDGGVAECGGGLHFSFHPTAARVFDDSATRYVACPIALEDIAVHPDALYPSKVKARRVARPIWECDAQGQPITKRLTKDGV